MELSPNARVTYEKRYLIKDENGNPLESPEDLLRRVAANIAGIEKQYGAEEKEIKAVENDFYEMMARALFMPNSPTLMNAGRELQQLSACFVLPLEDSMEGIFTALKHMALVQKTGGGTGFAFDRLRPSNDPVRSTNGVASGPISFLKIFDAATEAVKQGGTRRGANMGSLTYNHPNIIEFIRCKEKEDEINNFNLSVTVSDQFMEKATGRDPDPYYDLINPRTKDVYRDPETGNPVQLDARAVFDLIVQKAWEKGDPGIIFIDQMNRYNPTPHIGLYETTNPCVPGDTFVQTLEGPRMVRDLLGEITTLIVDGKSFPTTREGFFSTGFKPVLVVKTREGYSLRATENHPVLRVRKAISDSMEKEWTCVEDLKPGDRILLHDHRRLPGWNGLYEEKEGYLIGLLASEKSVLSEQPLISARACPDSGKITNRDPVTAITFTRDNDLRGRLKVGSNFKHMINPADLKKMAFSLGMLPGQKIITPYLETHTSCRFARGFLKGLFDTDGTLQVSQGHYVSIRIARGDRDKLMAVQRMLARFGIICSINAGCKPVKTTERPGGVTESANYKTGGQNELIISPGSAVIFAEKIGFSDPDKQNRLEAALSSCKPVVNRKHFIATVDQVLPDGTEEVYDVQVPGINCFDANGIVVHNCGEQPLLPHEACCLGSINLGKFVNGRGEIDWPKLAEITKTAVRFLDNVIDASNYVIPEISKMHKEGNRKIGLGIMGWHDLLVKLGIPYDSEEAVETADRIMRFISGEAKKESANLADKRGVFPNFKDSIFDTGLEEDRVRNATRTTIAPTGTISILAGCSSGIEPYFSIAFIRKNILDGMDLPEVNPLFLEIAQKEGFYSEEIAHAIAKTGTIPADSTVPEKYKILFKTAMEIDYSWHVRHQATFQQHTDNAVSKTINLKKEATVDDIKNAYISAWEAGCKGITIYRDSSRTKQVLNVGDGETEDSLKPTKRPKTLSGKTTSVRTALGNLFVTVNSADGKPFELFAQIGKAGSDVVAFTEAIARLISLALRCGVSVDEIVTQLEGIGGARSVGYGPNKIMSVPDAIGQTLRSLAQSETKNDSLNYGNTREICPDCGTCALIRAEGCLKCEACGYSEC